MAIEWQAMVPEGAAQLHLRHLSLLAVVLLVAGCGQTVARNPAPHHHHPIRARPPIQSPSGTWEPTALQQFTNPIGPPIAGATASACASALAARGVKRSLLTLVPPGMISVHGTRTVTVRLPDSMRGGPVMPARASYSPLEADYLNLLSSAVGLPLRAYLGKTLTLFFLDLPDTGPIGSYACLETAKHRVVGAFAQQLNYNFQPLFDVAANGQTADKLAHGSFLNWLAARGDFATAVPDRPGLTAQETLVDFFGVLDDPNLTVSARESLLAGYGSYGETLSMTFTALVPMSIAAFVPRPFPLPSGYRVFTVQLWPVFRHFSTMDVAGNGWQGGFITVQRAADGVWHVTGYSTGY